MARKIIDRVAKRLVGDDCEPYLLAFSRIMEHLGKTESFLKAQLSALTSR